MQVTLNRKDLYRFERLVNKLVNSHDCPIAVAFLPNPDGVEFTAFYRDATLCLTVPGVTMKKSFALPVSALKELAAKHNDMVTFDVTSTGTIANWNVNGIPQSQQYPSTNRRFMPKLSLPEKTETHPFRLFDVLADAAKCTDGNYARFALGNICLNGTKSRIAASDAKQAYICDGFAFPWEDEVLCPPSRIFGSRAIAEFGDSIQVGVTKDKVYFQIGVVTFWLKKIEGRFPDIDKLLAGYDTSTWLELDRSDAEFMVERLDDLPGKKQENSPVFLALNDTVAVRGYEKKPKSGTELRLSRSRYKGEPVTVAMNRLHLKQAIRFGVNRIVLGATEKSSVMGYGESDLKYLWMSLYIDEPVCNANKMTVLESDTKANAASTIRVPKPASKAGTKTKK
jgi:hypothetical protein